MATVTKDFKVKSGLVVEGANATVGGYDVLKKDNSSDEAYIIDLIGGETLVKSVGTNLSVDPEGQLSLDLVGIVEDVAGNRLTTDGSLINVDVDGIADDLTGSYDFATNSDVSMAVGQESTNRNDAIAAAVTDLEAYADQAELDAVSTANAYTDGRETAITTAYQTYADTAESDAVTTANAYTDTRETAITTAYQTYADTAEQDAKDYADTAIAALVDSAPATLDTLNELAAALQDNPDIISDLQDIAAGKQDTLTAGANIDITDDVVSVTGLASTDISDFATAAQSAGTGYFDPAGSASAAQTAAELYADGLAVNYDAAGSAATAQSNAETFATNAIDELTTDDIQEGVNNEYFTDERATDAVALAIAAGSHENIAISYSNGAFSFQAENGVADSTTTDLAEGTNLYFTDARAVSALEAVVPNFTEIDLNEVATQVAASSTGDATQNVVAYQFATADYRSAKFLVKVAYGTHTEVSEVLLTLDTSDNIAITEYAIVGTNGSAAAVSADVSGGNVRLLVTPTNNGSTIKVMGTLLV
jgi:hypothetical protein